MKESVTIANAIMKLVVDRREAILATVVRVQGSSYRKPGARFLITKDGKESWGMVSGGCLESDLFEKGQEVLQQGRPMMVAYDSTQDADILMGTGLGCRGKVELLVEAVHEKMHGICEWADFILNLHRHRSEGAVATVVSKGSKFGSKICFSAEEFGSVRSGFPGLNLGGNGIYPLDGEGEQHQAWVEYLQPVVHLVIFGGWKDTLPLVRYARELGWRTTLMDVRHRADRVGIRGEVDLYLTGDLNAAMEKIPWDLQTVGVVMNHHLLYDIESLAKLLQLPIPLPYVGLLGSRGRKQDIVDRLKEEHPCLCSERLGGIHGPVGLDLGSEGPQEIALSIVAEIVKELHARAAQIPNRRGPLEHACGTINKGIGSYQDL